MKSLIPIGVENIEAAAVDRQFVAEMRDNIRDNFSEYFNTHGFMRHDPGSIIPEHDNSVLFTGSTITTFKPYLEKENIPECGYYMVQSCLRTQNTKMLSNDTGHPQWASYFSSIGALTQYYKLNEISELIWQFYTTSLGIPADRLRIRISSNDIDLMEYWKNSCLNKYIELDANDPIYYTHKFGMDRVIGRNCNLAIVDHRTGELRDIGNIIVIETPNEKLGVEIAFGVETIVSRILGYQNPIEASLIADIVPVKNEHSLKLADAISSAIVILDAGERPVVTNRGRILRKYLQAISYLRHKVAIRIDEIERYAEKFEIKEFGSNSELPSHMVKYIIKYEELQAKGLKLEKINLQISSVIPAENALRQSRVSLSSRCFKR